MKIKRTCASSWPARPISCSGKTGMTPSSQTQRPRPRAEPESRRPSSLDSQADALITVRCGQNAAQVFQAAGIKLYKSANKAAADDLAALEQGTLEELTQFHGGYHGIQ